jgi:hypothetical protein
LRRCCGIVTSGVAAIITICTRGALAAALVAHLGPLRRAKAAVVVVVMPEASPTAGPEAAWRG